MRGAPGHGTQESHASEVERMRAWASTVQGLGPMSPKAWASTVPSPLHSTPNYLCIPLLSAVTSSTRESDTDRGGSAA